MKNKKFMRTLSMIVAIAMCLTILPAVALAGSQDWLEASFYDNNRMESYGYGTVDGNLTLNEAGEAKLSVSGFFSVSQNCTIKEVWLVDSETKANKYNLLTPSYGGENECQVFQGDGDWGVDIWIQNITIPNAQKGDYRLKVVTSNGTYISDEYEDEYYHTDGIVHITDEIATVISITTETLPAGFAKVAYNEMLRGSYVSSWSAVGLPEGLSLDAASGAISGTPAEDGTYSVTVTATDSKGESVSKTFTLEIKPAPKYTVTYRLNGAADYTGAYDPVTVEAGTRIKLPAAPQRGGYTFEGWGYGSKIYQPGDRYTVKGSINFIARWSEKPAVTAVVPDSLKDLPGYMWIQAYFGDSGSYYMVSVSEGVATLSSWYFSDGRTFSKLELYAYVNGERTIIGEYNGEVSDDSGEIALTSKGLSLAALNDFNVVGLTRPEDYRGYSGSLYMKDGERLYTPCIVTSDFSQSGKVTLSITPNRDSENYAAYDWDNKEGYTYSFDAASGVLNVTVPKIAPPSANVSGTVTVAGVGKRLAGVKVVASQNYKNMYRTCSAVTDENGAFSLSLYPGVSAYVQVYSGESNLSLYSGYNIDSPSNGAEYDIKVNSVNLKTNMKIQAKEGNEDVLKKYFNTGAHIVNITISGGGNTDKASMGVHVYSDAMFMSSTDTLNRTAAEDSVTVSVSSDAFEPTAAVTADVSTSRGEASFTLVPRPGVVVDLKAAFTVPAVLAWYDASGAFIDKSTAFSLTSYKRTFAFTAPSGAGSYKIALVPGAYESYLNDETGFDALPETIKTWSVTLEAGTITELEGVTADERATNNAVYVTKPGSTLYASQESFSSAGELVAFSGEIGLDSGINDGRLTSLRLRTGVRDRDHGWTCYNSAPVQAIVINGEDYTDKLSYAYHTDSYRMSGIDIELPCEYTIYCIPGSLELDMDVTLSADVNYNGGSTRQYYQLIGNAIVKRPGAYLDTLSTYVNRDTVMVSGRALPNEEVTVFDNGAGAGKAVADRWGDWTAEVTLTDVSDTGSTVHILTSLSASGEESDELWVFHNPEGPQLTSFTMTWTEHVTKTINVGEPYNFYGSSMRDVSFDAVFDNPDALEIMSEWGEDVKAVTKVFTNDGEIRFLPMTQSGDTFTGTVDTALRDSITYAELMYIPRSEPEEWDANTVETVAYDRTMDASEIAPDTGSVEELTSEDDWSVTFDGNVPTFSGNDDGLDAAAFARAADGAAQRGLKLNYIRMKHDVSGADNGTIAWLNAIHNERMADEGEDTLIFNFSGQLASEAAFNNAKSNIQKIAEDTHGTENVLPYQITDDAGHTVYRYIITDAWQEDGEIAYCTYFINASFMIDRSDPSDVSYYVFMTAQLTKDFYGYLINLNEPKAELRESDTEASLAYAEYSEGQSGPAYGWPQEHTYENNPLEGYGSGEHTPDEFHGEFDFDEQESYYQQESNSESALGYGSAGFGTAGVGPCGTIGTLLGLPAWAQANQRRERYRNYVKDMKREINEVLPNNPCYQALSETQLSTFKEQLHIFETTCNRFDFSSGAAELTDVAIVGASVWGGFAKLGWKAGAKLALGSFATGTVINTSCSNAMREVATEYVKTYKMIDSMCRARASQMRDPNCKKDEKSSSSSSSSTPRTSDGKPTPQNNDPSGVVYEGVIENPVSGAQVTLYYAADSYGNIVKEATTTDSATGRKTGTGNIEFGKTITGLNAADDVRFLMPQEAVQITGEDGRFGWGVPEGLWFVSAEYAGLSGTSVGDTAATVTVSGVTLNGLNVTKLLPVLPVQLEVNIPIVDETAPEVEDVLYTSEGIYVTFTKYMEDTANGAASVLYAANYTLSNDGGDITGFTVEAAVQGHTPANIAGEAVRTYTKTVLIAPASGSAFEGDVTLSVAGTVESYAGTPMGEQYTGTGTAADKEKLAAPVLSPASGEVERGSAVTVTAPEGATVYYTTDGSTPTTESPVCDGSIAIKGDMTIKAIAVKAGFNDSAVASGTYTTPKTLIRTLSATVRSSGGGSVEGLEFTFTGKDTLGGSINRTVKVMNGKLSMIGVPEGTYTLAFAGDDDFSASTQNVTVGSNPISLMITLVKKPSQKITVTDTVTGEKMSYLYEGDKITVSGVVSTAAPVYVAVYDKTGKMISVDILTSPSSADVTGGNSAKLIWLNKAGFIAKVKCIEIKLK